jgi:2-methylcitrate dehydratase PrpD
MVDRDAGPAQYTAERLKDDRVQALARRVDMYVEESVQHSNSATLVTIETLGGQLVSRRVEAARGAPSDPFSWAEMEAKFRNCASLGMTSPKVERALAAARAISQLSDVGVLSQAVSGEPAPGDGSANGGAY